MAQFYNLEEAASALGMSPEELKAKAQHREVRAFLDGGSWRFRVADIDELARRRGLGSDPELHLSDLGMPSTSDSSGDFDLSEFQMGAPHPDLGAPTMDFSAKHPSPTGSSDHDILLDDLSLPPNPVTGSSSVIIGMGGAGKAPSDSDVRLVPDHPKGSSDSDVRLAPAHGIKAPSDSDVTLIAEDTSHHDLIGAGGKSDTAVRMSPMLGSSAEVPVSGVESDSDFELTPSSVIEALQPDSGSDFELSALDGSDEFDSTPLSKPSDSDVTAAEPSLSGINLSRPSDSGINLQAASGLNLHGGGESIELAPLSGDELPAAPKSKAKPQPKAPAKGAPAGPKSLLSATPPPSARKGEKDIFDDTDFEVDALGTDESSDDKTVQFESTSDFELEESDTGSEVFAIDEEDVDQNAATSIGSAALEDEDEFAESTSGEMSASAWDVESDTPSTAGRSAPATVLSTAGASAEWGGLWVGMLGVASLFMLFAAFISLDLVRNLYDFQGNSPASGIVKSLAGIIGG